MSSISRSALPAFFDFFCLGKKFLVFNLVSRNLKIKYRRSIFGVLWTLLSPLAMALVYYFVFKVVLKVQMPQYLVFILSGVLAWNFFAQSLLEGMDSLVSNWDLLRKIPIPLQVFPFTVCVTNTVTFLLSIPILLGAALLSHAPLGASLALVPTYLVCLTLITYCIAFAMALLYVYFRDLKHLMTIALQIWFYATPVIYQESMIPPKYHWVLLANPLGGLFSGLHSIFVRGEWPTPESMGSMLIWTAASLVIAMLLQRRFANEIVESI